MAVRFQFALLLFCLGVFPLNAAPVLESHGDAWDISNGITITATSGIRAGFSASDIFGTVLSAERGHTVFADGRPEGFVHYIEWQTLTPIWLTSFNLFASGDGAIYDNEREIGSFVLKAKLNPADPFTMISTLTPSHPYAFEDSSTLALVSTTVTPVNAQYFRAEFVQWNAGRGFDGPRITELDGFATTPEVQIPESTDDLFDVHHGARVLAASPTISGFSPDAILGDDRPSAEPATTIFEDGGAEGSLHFIEWKTAGPVRLTSFNLFASGDPPIYNYEREFGGFVFQAKLRLSDSYTTIYTFSPAHPYPFLDPVSKLILSANVSPIDAEYFRAEFVQFNAGRGFDGPRVIELDGFGTASTNTIGDGIPDTWRLQFFPSVTDPNASAMADPDGDGANNYQEYTDGTNPLVPGASNPLLTISPASGNYDSPLTVTTVNRSPATVRYTLDGSDPIGSSAVFSNSFPLGASTTVKARLFVGSLPVSAIESRTYVLTEATHIHESRLDLFDVRQGTQLLAASPIWASFARDGMFGNDSPSVEPGSTVFGDGQPSGFEHYIEWKTARPIQLTSFVLFASGDPPIYNHEREFERFVLKAKSRSSDSYTTVYTYSPEHPYRFLDPATKALLSASIAPIQAEFFRAEFIQRDAGRGFDGPRIIELDGFGSILGWSLDDGIPDAWRLQFFAAISDPNAAALADPDGDGANNYQEFVDGTNPLFPDPVVPQLLSASPSAGSYFGPLIIHLTARGTAASIRYTLDGSEPVVSSAVYPERGIQLAESASLKARLFVGSAAVSTVLEANYALMARPAIGISDSDLFDVRQGARVLRGSDLFGGGNANAIFGGSYGAEPNTTIFADGRPENFVHYVEWQTAAPIVLNSINLFASGDGAIYNYEREFNRFILQAKRRLNDNFVTIYSFEPGRPYTFLDSNTRALVAADIPPTEAWYFRVEFIQRDGGRGFDGPRVIELDGFGSVLPMTLNDGIPDSWRIEYFGSVSNLNGAALADPDNDGANNFQEYLDGTNPTSPDASMTPLLTISPLSGTFTAPLEVRISGRGPAVIRYTFDGTEPTAASVAFTNALTLTASATVRARLFVNENPVSATVNETYSIKPPKELPASPGPSLADAFDIRQGARILRTSGIRRGFYAESMFGGDARSVETGSTIFQDGRTNQYTHFIEFKTAAPLQLQKLNLYAAGDPAIYNHEREFGSFTLRAKSSSEREDYDLVVARFTPASHPYDYLDQPYLVFTVSSNELPRFSAQFFKAEFVQWNAGRDFDAPRIIELDGFGEMSGGINPILADWTFEEGQPGQSPVLLKDYSGNGHDGGELVGPPSFVSTAPSVDGFLSLKVGGTNSSGFVAGPSPDFNFGEGFTLEVLLEPFGREGVAQTIFAAQDELTHRLVHLLAYDPLDRVVRFVSLSANGDSFSLSAPFPGNGQSHHLAVVSRNHEVTLFIDGSMVASAVCPLVPGYTLGGMGRVSVGLNLASFNGTGFNGVIDRVRIAGKAFVPSEFFSTHKEAPPLIITRHLVDRVVDSGAEAVFEVEALGIGPISYEWRFNGQIVAGASSNRLVLANVGLDRAGIYTVTVNSGTGQSVSSARLSVREPTASEAPIILSQPESRFVPLGSAVQFSVVTSGPGPLCYQWLFNGADIPGATNDTFRIGETGLASAGTYIVKVSNGTGTTESQGATLNLSVSGQAGGEIYMNNRTALVDAPITDHLGNRLSRTDYLVQLYTGLDEQNLAPVGPAIPFQNGIGAGYFADGISRIIPGVSSGSSAVLQVRAWEANGGNTYEAAQSNSAPRGQSSSFVTVTGGGTTPPGELVGLQSFSLHAPPRITRQPESIELRAGEAANFSVQVTGSDPLVYQWRFNGAALQGAVSNSLTIPNVQVSDAGEYTVAISNLAGSTLSAVAVLHLSDSVPPAVTILSPGGLTTETRYSLSGTVSDNKGVTRLEWEKNGQVIGEIPFPDGRFEVADLLLSAGENIFRVRAFDQAGNGTVREISVVLETSHSVGVPSVPSIQEGTKFSVPISIISGGDVAAITFDLAYDTNYFSSPEFEWTEITGGALQQVNLDTPGIVRASFALAGGTLQKGDHVLARVEFRPRSVPSNLEAALTLHVLGIYSAQGDPILSGTEIKSGTVTIIQRNVTGDNNGNDRLDVGDASVIMRLVALIDPVREWDIVGNDLNENKTLDAGDAVRVLRVAANIDPQPKGGQFLARQALRASVPSQGAITLTSDERELRTGGQLTIRASFGGLTASVFGASFSSTLLRNS